MSKAFLEAMECLECLFCEPEDYRSIGRKKDYDTIKQYILKAQDEEKENELLKGQTKYFTEVVTEFQKTIRVIKEKKVNIDLLNASSLVEDYNNEIVRTCGSRFSVGRLLTQEEFDLLKRCC